jgi:hypothetical protein
MPQNPERRQALAMSGMVKLAMAALFGVVVSATASPTSVEL